MLIFLVMSFLELPYLNLVEMRVVVPDFGDISPTLAFLSVSFKIDKNIWKHKLLYRYGSPGSANLIALRLQQAYEA